MTLHDPYMASYTGTVLMAGKYSPESKVFYFTSFLFTLLGLGLGLLHLPLPYLLTHGELMVI